jgi:hypothetical protein
MTEWNTLPVGATKEVDDNGAGVHVHHPKDGVFVIRRFFDGAWQNTVWVRQGDIGWGVSREVGTLGTPAEDLLAAITAGIIRSREAVGGAPPAPSP